MKLKNLFKKAGVSKTSSIQKISKDQLEKVIGGAEEGGSIPFVGGAIAGAASNRDKGSFNTPTAGQ